MNKELIEKVKVLFEPHVLVNNHLAEELISLCADKAIKAVGANYHIMPKEKETTGVKLHNSVIDRDIEAIEKEMK